MEKAIFVLDLQEECMETCPNDPEDVAPWLAAVDLGGGV
jgi:hypothetical protein